jgi:hypothetical protein
MQGNVEGENMSVLKSLKLSDAKPVAQAKTPVERGREKLIENLALQRKFAEATIAGTVFEPPKHFVMRTNGEGARVRVEVPRRIRKGWFEDGNRTTHFSLFYAGKILELGKGKTAIEVGALANLPTLIDSLIEAVRAGELDSAVNAAAAERGRVLNRSEKPKAA